MQTLVAHLAGNPNALVVLFWLWYENHRWGVNTDGVSNLTLHTITWEPGVSSVTAVGFLHAATRGEIPDIYTTHWLYADSHRLLVLDHMRTSQTWSQNVLTDFQAFARSWAAEWVWHQLASPGKMAALVPGLLWRRFCKASAKSSSLFGCVSSSYWGGKGWLVMEKK